MKQNNDFTNELDKNQEVAKKKLRLSEVYKYIKIINYEDKVKYIEELEEKKQNAEEEYEEINKEIETTIEEIKNKKGLMLNEGEAAKKINNYLSSYFGHPSLSLQPVEEMDEETQSKQIKFKVYREKEIAYNLSGGEKNLIAFCYFITTIDGEGIEPKKTIIWIDDPVSSLDNNHIFFIYSLIEAELVKKKRFKQLFISTHNLSFLKYLLRLQGDKIYLISEKEGNKSFLRKMPKYLKEYITEFIYLFEQIYRCANEKESDENYFLFYNFGNNARKFLEIYLFYKYPGLLPEEEYEKFFNENIPAFLTNRIVNEMSHLSGTLERGEEPVEYEEIKKDAQCILDKIKNSDKDQYESFLKCIGVEDE